MKLLVWAGAVTSLHKQRGHCMLYFRPHRNDGATGQEGRDGCVHYIAASWPQTLPQFFHLQNRVLLIETTSQDCREKAKRRGPQECCQLLFWQEGSSTSVRREGTPSDIIVLWSFEQWTELSSNTRRAASPLSILNILEALNFCEDLVTKLFLPSLIVDLDCCDCHLAGSWGLCAGLSVTLADVRLFRQRHAEVTLEDRVWANAGRAEAQLSLDAKPGVEPKWVCHRS
jgi:hypothetical protein